MKLVQHDLEAHPPAAAVLGVALAITPARSRKIQHGLFAAPAPEPERLSLTLDKIRAMVGAANVGAPELLDTWRREAWELRELDYQPSVPFSAPQAKETGAPVPVAFRYFRPPRPARVELAGGMPRRVIAQGISGRVVRATGPWRSSGEWWRATLWDRDEWDVLLAPAADRTAVYRLFQDRKSKGWFVEGEYD
jgi:protein ImuB